MPPIKQPVKDTRTPQEIAIQSAVTSHYNTLIPGYEAKHIRIKNPLTGKDPLFNTSDPSFYELFYDLAQMGLKNKMMNELQTFAETIDPNWQAVYSALQGYFKAKETANAASEDIGQA